MLLETECSKSIEVDEGIQKQLVIGGLMFRMLVTVETKRIQIQLLQAGHTLRRGETPSEPTRQT